MGLFHKHVWKEIDRAISQLYDPAYGDEAHPVRVFKIFIQECTECHKIRSKKIRVI